MTNEERDFYGAGYMEARDCVAYRLERILASCEDADEVLGAVKDLVEELAAERRQEAFRSAQELCPGMTREEYEAELAESARQIRAEHYGPNGFLKPRLVR